MLAGCLAVLATHETVHMTDRAFGHTWCSFGTCDLTAPAHIQWSHGLGSVMGSCVDPLPPYTVTPVDSINVTIWAPDAHNTLYTTFDGQPEQDMELVLLRNGMSETITTLPIEVTQTRQTWTLRSSVVEPLWARLRTRRDPADPNPVVNNVVYYEFLIWDSTSQAPPANAACATDPTTCEQIGYANSTACVEPTPCVEANAGVHDCTCECCAGAGCTNRTFIAGSATSCTATHCASTFGAECDDSAGSAASNGATVHVSFIPVDYCQSCGFDDCTCDCCSNGVCLATGTATMQVGHESLCTASECARVFYDCPNDALLSSGTAGYSNAAIYIPHTPCEPPGQPPPPPPCRSYDCECACCFSESCPEMTVRTWMAGSRSRCTVDLCSTRFASCPDRGSHNAGSNVVPSYYPLDQQCIAPPPSPTPQPPPSPLFPQPSSPSPLSTNWRVSRVADGAADSSGDDFLVVLLVVLLGTTAACAVMAFGFLAFVRSRERRGVPVWSSLAPIPAVSHGSAVGEPEEVRARRDSREQRVSRERRRSENGAPVAPTSSTANGEPATSDGIVLHSTIRSP